MNLFVIIGFFLLSAISIISIYVAITEKRKREKLLKKIRKEKEGIRSKSKELRYELKLLSKALNLIKEGIVIMDPYGRIVFTNRFARELLGISPKDEGKYFYQAIKNFDIVTMINENFNESYKAWQERKLGNRYVQIIFGSDLDEKVLLLIDLTEIKKYENLKKDFIANVSHELKTPLAAMKLSLETLENECKENPIAKKFIEKATERVNYMEQLIEDLITLSMLENVNFQVNIEELNLFSLIKKIVSDLSEIAEKKEVKIEVKVPKSAEIKTNEKMLHAILKNLIDNAIKYNKKGGKVQIEYKELTNEVEISICDTGIGIPKSHLPFIFERFYRVERSRSRKSGGTGLGLSIVKLGVEKLKGKVEVESEEGKGSCFRIYLPK